MDAKAEKMEKQLTLGQRLTAERTRLKLTQAELSKLMDWSQTRISGYENDRRAMSLQVIYEFCKKAKADPHFMVFGEYGNKTIPHFQYDAETVVKFCTEETTGRVWGSYCPDNYKLIDSITIDKFYGDHAFALTIPDDSNAPDVEPGDLAIFAPYDPNHVSPGAYVLAYVEEEKAKRLYIRRLKKCETRMEDQLVPVNGLYPALTYKHTNFTIIAVGVELRKFTKQKLNF